MTGRVLVKADGQYRSLVAPWVGHGGEGVRAQKLFRKEGGTWIEKWPLIPPPPENIELAFAYDAGTDSIEMDLTWDAPTTAIDIDHFEVLLSSGDSFLTEVGDTSISGGSYEMLIGQTVVATVLAVSDTGTRGEPGFSAEVPVPQFPAPPTPTDVDIVLANRSATMDWDSINTKRITGFEIKTTYRSTAAVFTAGPSERSKNITSWNTQPIPGDPGGALGAIIRAVGPGGVSDWASTSGTVPNVPNPPPPPTVAVPGTPVISNHRFLNGVLRADFSVPGATSVNVWWEVEGGATTHISTLGVSGSVSAAATASLARDEISRYRLVFQGSNAGGSGARAYGPWARKLPNPYYVLPEHTLPVRLNEVWSDGVMRQGASFNEFSFMDPVIVWRSFALYGNRIVNSLGAARVGYTPTITKGEVFLWRETTGGSGAGVRPRLWYHPYTSPSQIMGFALSGGHDLAPLTRGQGSFLEMNLSEAQRMADGSGAKGVAVYHPNAQLLGYLGNVSSEYIRFYNWQQSFFGIPAWSLRFYHDG